jgi:hypothetical protein
MRTQMLQQQLANAQSSVRTFVIVVRKVIP